MTDIWAELGIARTGDAAAIRRAYAAQIKAVRPDVDPQGFARLRTAYERALANAESAAPTAATVHVAAPAAAPAPDPPSRVNAAFSLVSDCVRRGKVVAAADHLAASRAAGTLSMDEAIRLADQLGWSLAQDRSLSANAVREVATRLGWDDDDTGGPWAKTLRARLDGERWLATLRIQAKSRWVFVGAAQALAARILLGRGKLRTVPSMARDPMLRQRYGEFLLHAYIVGKEFDPVRIESVRALLAGPRAKPPSGFLLLFRPWMLPLAILAIAWVAGQVTSWIDPLQQDLVSGLTMIILVVMLLARRLSRYVGMFRERRRNRQ